MLARINTRGTLHFNTKRYFSCGLYCFTTMNRSAIERLQATQLHLLGGRRTLASTNKTSSSFYSTSTSPSDISNRSVGTKFTTDYKNYAIGKNGKVISYFHDINLDLDISLKTANMVVEIPKWSNGKFEISTSQPGNPIVQDVKKGKVRFVKNLFPYKGYIHNYGAFPQTWEDPTVKNQEVGDLYGDNDPLDVCEIGDKVGELGQIKKVKILGSLALIDDGELDWKVIVVDVTDPLAAELNDITDVKEKCPGYLEATVTWFRNYKMPDGKPENSFAFNAEYRNQQETIEVIQECRHAWEKLVKGETKGDNLPNITNTTLQGTPGYVSKYDGIASGTSTPDAKLPEDVDKSYYF